MGGRPPATIMTDQDLAMISSIAAELPDTKHALCIWHITQKFPSYFRSTLKGKTCSI